MRQRAVLAAIVAALFGVPAAAAHASTFLVPEQLRVVNYYPAQNGWTYMWQRWDPAAIDRDFGRIEGLHANTVRVIVQTRTFGWPRVRPVYQRRLAQVFDIAARHQLRVQLTLFDWWGSYRQVKRSELWARQLLASYANDQRLAFVELQNELDPRKPEATAWARTMLPFLRTIVPGVPLTISVSGSDPLGNLLLLKQQLGDSTPDFWTVHYYDKPELAYPTLAQAKAIAAPLPLFVGETGYWPGASDPPVRTQADREDEQVRFLHTVANAADALGLPPVAPWILSDFARNAIPNRPGPSEYHFGLFRVDGTPKPAAEAVREIFGSVPSPVDFDEGFEQPEPGAPRPEPAQWRRRGAGDFALDATVAHGGAASASIGAVLGRPTFRAMFTTAPPTPWVSPGQTLTLSAWVRGERASGTTTVSLLYFDSSRHYLARADSQPLPNGTTDWTQLSTTSIVPPSASYVRIELDSDGNGGRVWFDDVALARG